MSRSRTYFTPEQVDFLEKSYDTNQYPDQQEKEQIALKTGLNENKVQVWFSNRRARQRKNLTNNAISTAEVRYFNKILKIKHLKIWLKFKNFQNLLHSAAIQRYQQQAHQQVLSPPNNNIQQFASIPAPKPVFNQPLPAANYPLFQQPPISILNYLQQQQFLQLYAAFNQQKQQSKLAP